jgi:hypothetical protein
MLGPDVASLNQRIGNTAFIQERRKRRHHDKDFEQSEIMRRKRTRRYHDPPDAQSLNDELRHHIGTNRSRERVPQPAIALGVLRSAVVLPQLLGHNPSPRSRTGMVRKRILIPVANDQSSRN